MRDALNKAGLACTGYEWEAPDDRDVLTRSAADAGECNIENEKVEMIIWKDKGQKENWIGVYKKFGCEMAKGFGTSTFDFVNGELWIVDQTSQTLAKKVAGSIGGKAEHVDCR